VAFAVILSLLIVTFLVFPAYLQSPSAVIRFFIPSTPTASIDPQPSCPTNSSKATANMAVIHMVEATIRAMLQEIHMPA